MIWVSENRSLTDKVYVSPCMKRYAHRWTSSNVWETTHTRHKIPQHNRVHRTSHCPHNRSQASPASSKHATNLNGLNELGSKFLQPENDIQSTTDGGEQIVDLGTFTNCLGRSEVESVKFIPFLLEIRHTGFCFLATERMNVMVQTLDPSSWSRA